MLAMNCCCASHTGSLLYLVCSPAETAVAVKAYSCTLKIVWVASHAQATIQREGCREGRLSYSSEIFPSSARPEGCKLQLLQTWLQQRYAIIQPSRLCELVGQHRVRHLQRPGCLGQKHNRNSHHPHPFSLIHHCLDLVTDANAQKYADMVCAISS